VAFEAAKGREDRPETQAGNTGWKRRLESLRHSFREDMFKQYWRTRRGRLDVIIGIEHVICRDSPMFPPELRKNQGQSAIPAILEAVPIDAQERSSGLPGHNGTNTNMHSK